MELVIIKDCYEYGKDIITSKEYRVLENFIQHGDMNCLQHCFGVAVCALALARRLNINCDEKALVRGALLHDYFLYDWHEKSLWHTWHGFTHAKTALKNAGRDFKINEIEQEVIKKHMWPLNPALPCKKEAWLVTMADKYCSGLETLGQIPFLGFLQGMVVKANI